MFEAIGAGREVGLTLYTDSYIIRGTTLTRQRRVSDILNTAEHDFVVLEGVSLEDLGTRVESSRAAFAQVNLGAVLFAVAAEPIEPMPELRTPKLAERALISIPPFQVAGWIHLMPERNLRDALTELTGRFIPVTDAVFWSDARGEPRQTAAMVAVNHARAHILAPFDGPGG